MKHSPARIRRPVLRPDTVRPDPSEPFRRRDRIRRCVRGAVRWLAGHSSVSRPGPALGSDRGDISITTVIIWVAAVTGALLIAGTIAVVITKYNDALSGL